MRERVERNRPKPVLAGFGDALRRLFLGRSVVLRRALLRQDWQGSIFDFLKSHTMLMEGFRPALHLRLACDPPLTALFDSVSPMSVAWLSTMFGVPAPGNPFGYSLASGGWRKKFRIPGTDQGCGYCCSQKRKNEYQCCPRRQSVSVHRKSISLLPNLRKIISLCQ